MNRFHIIIRLAALFPGHQIFESVDKDLIIVRKHVMDMQIERKPVPHFIDRTLHIDTCRLMLLKKKLNKK